MSGYLFNIILITLIPMSFVNKRLKRSSQKVLQHRKFNVSLVSSLRYDGVKAFGLKNTTTSINYTFERGISTQCAHLSQISSALKYYGLRRHFLFSRNTPKCLLPTPIFLLFNQESWTEKGVT